MKSGYLALVLPAVLSEGQRVEMADIETRQPDLPPWIEPKKQHKPHRAHHQGVKEMARRTRQQAKRTA